MRVQPHLPSRPLLTMVMSRSGLALCACSAANSPAPPVPRIKMSVCKRSIFMPLSKHAHQKNESDDRRDRRGKRRQLLLPVAPVEVLDHQDAQAAEEVDRQQKDETTFGDLHQRLVAPAQKAVEPRTTMERKPQHEEVDRQKDRQRHARQPMNHRRDPQRAAAMLQAVRDHATTNAKMA